MDKKEQMNNFVKLTKIYIIMITLELLHNTTSVSENMLNANLYNSVIKNLIFLKKFKKNDDLLV